MRSEREDIAIFNEALVFDALDPAVLLTRERNAVFSTALQPAQLVSARQPVESELVVAGVSPAEITSAWVMQ